MRSGSHQLVGFKLKWRRRRRRRRFIKRPSPAAGALCSAFVFGLAPVWRATPQSMRYFCALGKNQACLLRVCVCGCAWVMTLGVCCVVSSVDNVGMIILTHTHTEIQTSSLIRHRQARLLILYLTCEGASVCGLETFHYLPCWRCQMEIECVRTHLRPEHRARSIYPPAAAKSLLLLEIGLVLYLYVYFNRWMIL